jgi:hypothetical protein
MVPLRTDPIDACFDTLEREIERDPALSRELESSRKEFLRPWNGAEGNPAEAALAERRLLEWFLLEKERSTAAEARVAALIERCVERTENPDEVARALMDSHASVFEVSGVDPESGVKLWDLAGLFECTAIEPDGSRLLESGDLIAGRVFPTAGSTCRISRAAVVWRNPKLLAAVRADLDRARTDGPSGRKGTFRLRQADLEAMFHGRDAAASEEPDEEAPSAVARARRLLSGAGIDEPEIESIFRFLSEQAPGDGDLVPGVLPGGRDALAAVLDELAFGTSIDLETARESLRAAWQELHARKAPAPAARRPSRTADVASAVAAFDRRRNEGASLDETFRDLERDLGLADEPSDEEEDTPAPDFPGVVGAIVEEFLWDEAREHGERSAERSSILRSLSRFAAGIGVFENLTAKELAAYACHWVFAEREVTTAEDARRLLEALERFCAWAEETQEVPLRATFAPVLERVRDSLPRLAEANRFAAPGPATEGLEWLDVIAIEGDGSLRVAVRPGEEAMLHADPAIVARLSSGDVVRGRRVAGGGLEIHGCFPAEIRQLENG